MKQEILLNQGISYSSLYRANTLHLTATINEVNNSNGFPWKQTGIYGLEFLGAFVGSVYCCYGIASRIATTGETKGSFSRYILSNVVITSTCCWGTGKLLKENGSWRKTAIGAGVGSLIGSILLATSFRIHTDSLVYDDILGLIIVTTPSLGAVVGFNF